MFDDDEDGVHIYADDDELTAYFEFKNDWENDRGILFGHIEVHKPSKSVIKRIRDKWPEMMQYAADRNFDQILSYSKNERFVKFLNGNKLAEFENEFGETYGVYIWELKQLLERPSPQSAQ